MAAGEPWATAPVSSQPGPQAQHFPGEALFVIDRFDTLRALTRHDFRLLYQALNAGRLQGTQAG